MIPQKGKSSMTQRLVTQLHQWEKQIQVLVVNDHPKETPTIDGASVIDNKGQGVTAAWENGIVAAHSDSILLLNNDVECKGAFVETILGCILRGVVGVRLRRESIVGRSVLEGWCFAFRRSLWKKLRLNRKLKFYYSDTDFMLRAEKAGKELVTVDLPFEHMLHATSRDTALFPLRYKILGQDRKRFRGLWRK